MQTINFRSPEFFQFLQSFCSEDDIRPKLMKPTVYEDGFVYACDAHMMIFFYDKEFGKVNEDKVIKFGIDATDGKYIANEYEHFIESQATSSERIIISKDISPVLEKIRVLEPEYKIRYVECDECNGEGEIECECCGKSSNCKTCDGDGELEASKETVGSYWKYPEEVAFKVHSPSLNRHMFIHPRLFSNLAENMEKLGLDALLVLDIDVKQEKLFCRIEGTDLYLIVMGLQIYSVTDQQYKLFEINL